MQLAICSFSFHRLLAAGKQDVFQYIKDCRKLGCTQLDPWNAHLAQVRQGDSILHAGHNPHDAKITAADQGYLAQVRCAADKAGLPFGCIAVDGAHIYDAAPEARAKNRLVAYRWLDVAELLGAPQVRIDCGGPENLPDDVLAIIVEGYRDIIQRAGDKGIEVLIENHWGPSPTPKNLIRILTAVKGLGLLFDSFNWKQCHQGEGWLTCAKYARATHIKTFEFAKDGEELTQHVGHCIKLLKAAGYKGAWGIESCPTDGDELTGAKNTIKLIRRHVEGAGAKRKTAVKR